MNLDIQQQYNIQYVTTQARMRQLNGELKNNVIRIYTYHTKKLQPT